MQSQAHFDFLSPKDEEELFNPFTPNALISLDRFNPFLSNDTSDRNLKLEIFFFAIEKIIFEKDTWRSFYCLFISGKSL